MKDNDHESDKDKDVERVKNFINKYRQSVQNTENIKTNVLLNLAALKSITAQHKTTQPNPNRSDQAFAAIQQHLGDAESSETLRQERWHGTVNCIYCASKHIKRLSKQEQKSEYNHKYLCLDCGKTFNDDSNTKIEIGVPPLNAWMLCWYLIGCSTSLQYISSRLGLSMATIEMMVSHMRKLFNTEQPLQHMLSFEDWAAQNSIKYKPVLEAAIAKQTVLYGMDIAGVAKDTGEYRRMKERTRGDQSSRSVTNKNKNKPIS